MYLSDYLAAWSFCSILQQRGVGTPPLRAYSGDMRTMIVSTIIGVVLLSCLAYGDETARIGSAFADIYGAFAPLSVLHRSYADYLFYGTDVTIPESLDEACDETGYLLATLYLDLIVQTGPEIVGTMPRLARLRADLALFCESYSPILVTLTSLESLDLAVLKEASALGVFSDIYRLQGGLQSAFEAYLDGLIDEQGIWSFGAAFSLRTLLTQMDLTSIDPGLQGILYGSEDTLLPPAFVSDEVALAIERLVKFVDRPLDKTRLDEVRYLAQLIYDSVVGQP